MEKIKPKKSLGQHFLNDKNILLRIAGSINCSDSDIIIEIGPGTGALTEYILNKVPKHLFSVEIDKRAVEALYKSFPVDKLNNFDIINSDIRNINIRNLLSEYGFDDNIIKVIGNIPYNISADIFFWIFNQSNIIDKAVLMVQKEVAQRLCAKPRTKSYGILTVAVNVTGSCKTLFDVSPECFFPKPKVTSSVIEIMLENNKFNQMNFKTIMNIVKSAFSHRRKVIRNSMKSYFTNEGIDFSEFQKIHNTKYPDYFSKRAEELSPEDFIKLYHSISEFKDRKNQ
ncbi:16S rRNA (adenine(1518)-N(6)/adenine(1519)-N(6))-dimethyltransferase RsmA [Bacteroidota bacterium]